MVGLRERMKRGGVGRMSQFPITMGFWGTGMTRLKLQAGRAWVFVVGKRIPPSVLSKHSLSSQFPVKAKQVYRLDINASIQGLWPYLYNFLAHSGALSIL